MTTERAAAAAALPARIAFLGLGLIGGSIAMALREAGYSGRISAWTPERRGPVDAARRGIVDEASPDASAALASAELVVLAGPPIAILASIASLAGPLRAALSAGSTVSDVGSTKVRIVAAADEAALPFVGSHPMAGRETTGFDSATADLFVDRPWVVVPGESARAADVGRVETLVSAVGARLVRLAADEHDAAVAAISHVPLVVAASLVEAMALDPVTATAWPLARELAASGWRDTTRLAKGDAEMGAGILATNSTVIAARLRVLRDVIERWIDQLEAGGADVDALRDRLEAARVALTSER